MPLIAHNALPSYMRLAREGHVVLEPGQARRQDIRELHIGLLNMMPDAALEATERQFLRLIGSSNRIAQFHVHLFSIDGLGRGDEAVRHIDRYYETTASVMAGGLDALIVTGANITGPDLSREKFFGPMCEIVDWAFSNVTSILCSCLASHAVWRHRYGLERRRLPQKLWGVFPHRTIVRDHALVAGVNTRFEAPHSRYNEVSRARLEAAGIRVLTDSRQAGVLLATSSDGLRFVFMQGHPEYDTTSLAKEYKREVRRFIDRERVDYPPFPENYFDAAAQSILAEFREQALQGAASGEFPEESLEPHLDNTWIDTGKAIFNNWLGLVYQTTGHDRHSPFMAHIDPLNPLQSPPSNYGVLS